MFFKQFTLGPLNLRIGGGDNWSQIDFGLTTCRSAGMASRETAVRIGFKSDHLLELSGQSNPNDQYIAPDGQVFYGKISLSPGGAVHILSAAQIYAEHVRCSLTAVGLKAADVAATVAV